ncbi:uncharacterized protein TDEL_0D02900 [Torulaspora delbrueckii]|uniref:Uncharacterized protein n=1 Tax=Torulaspora delbrueckii TaxID=4950 RepID=G8ZTD0_TORDE|nr:hypothetical protein TDEL_0D02900 [Torulaspora delbrueckii]CCE91874.1 hypothetical protein TDEL_0D02900 [Torulaspora delbrueckii]
MPQKIKIIQKKSTEKHLSPLQIQKYVWLAGHAMTLALGLLFSVTYLLQCLIFFKYRSWKWLFLRMNRSYSFFSGHRWYHAILRWTPALLYRLALIGTFMSLGVTSYQNSRGLHPQWFEMLSAENFQYLLISVFWFFTGASVFKIAPLMLLSYMHLTNWKQEIDGMKDEDEVTKKYAPVLNILAISEMLVAVSLALDAILLKSSSSGVVLVVYLGIYWLRINFSPYVQITMLRLLSKLDKKVPPKYHDQWEIIKKFIYSKIQDHEKRKTAIKKTA